MKFSNLTKSDSKFQKKLLLISSGRLREGLGLQKTAPSWNAVFSRGLQAEVTK